MESLRPQIAVNGTLTTTFKFSGGRNLVCLYSAAEQICEDLDMTKRAGRGFGYSIWRRADQ